MTGVIKKSDNAIRTLRRDDLAAMVAIDHAYTNQTRRRFFEKRLDVAKVHPEDFIHVGLDHDGALVAFAFARILRGEFGREDTVAVLDIMGVAPKNQKHGLGHALIQGLCDRLRDKGVRVLNSQADWTNHGLLQFFDSFGFTLAPRLVLQRTLAEPLAELTDQV